MKVNKSFYGDYQMSSGSATNIVYNDMVDWEVEPIEKKKTPKEDDVSDEDLAFIREVIKESKEINNG